jgi:hypothetical protein
MIKTINYCNNTLFLWRESPKCFEIIIFQLIFFFGLINIVKKKIIFFSVHTSFGSIGLNSKEVKTYEYEKNTWHVLLSLYVK